MYEYRKWPRAKQKAALKERIQRGFPIHSPPHIEDPGSLRIITAACFEHRHILNSDTRIGWFQNELLKHLSVENVHCSGWVVLPNHYHLLVRIDDIKVFSKSLGRLHGRTSFEMNREDKTEGRKCWFRCEDRTMRSHRTT